MKKLLIIFCLIFSFVLTTHAKKVASEGFVPSSKKVFGINEMLGNKIDVVDPTVVVSTDNNETGALKLRDLFGWVIAYLKRLIVPLAMIMMVIAGIIIIVSRDSEEIKKQKNKILLMIGGLMLIIISVVLVDNVFFGKNGEIFQTADGTISTKYALAGLTELEGLINFATTFLVAIGVLMLIIAAYRLIFTATDDESMKNAKNQVIWSLVGIFLILISNKVVEFVTINGDAKAPVTKIPQLNGIITLSMDWVNYIFSFMGIMGVVAIVVAGVQLVFFFGDDDRVETAKKTIINVIIGLILAASLYTIIRFFAMPGTG